MKVTNKTSFEVIAFGWHIEAGYGDDVSIKPDETKEILGPYLGECDGGQLISYAKANLVCREHHDAKDSGNHLHLSLGKPISYGTEREGVVVRHYRDDILGSMQRESLARL